MSDAYRPIPQCAFLTSHHAAPDAFLSMGVVMSATASLDWLSTLTGQSIRDLSQSIDQLHESGRAFESPICAPWLNGNRTPHNRPDARAQFDGIGLSTDAAMLGWSILEGVAFQFRECQMEQINANIHANSIAMVGGGSNNTLWCRMIATLLEQPVHLPVGRELAACLGATRLAQVAAGVGTARDILSNKPRNEALIEPDQAMASKLFDRYERYRTHVCGSLS